ncbi:seminal vesicle secretory protein 5-like [Alexandromys fortis]|uniref:seminal vesicle secretory protein 5-like n=1 Tax=Alexandromys fortis TaxID=100897 RepID=UPI0021526A9B|nr:seminal vesicle secretory protein 5-like [Microtus fortis]
MNPTSFFLLTLLLVLVTEASARRPREKFSQGSEEHSSEISEVGGSSRGSSSANEEYSRSESSWSSFKSKYPKSGFSEEGSWSSFKSKNPKSGFSEEGSWSSFKSKNPKRGFSEDGHLDYKTRGSRGEEGMSSFKSRMKTRIAGK